MVGELDDGSFLSLLQDFNYVAHDLGIEVRCFAPVNDGV
jgi:hypothetical protein